MNISKKEFSLEIINVILEALNFKYKIRGNYYECVE